MKITIKNTISHFRKICIHKYWVAKYCFKAGLYWQGITHDLSKFSPIEFWESVRFYQGTSSPINAAKEAQGYSLAWQHHKGRNPHHYEHWTDNYDSGTTCIEMPYKYAVELICDYLGAGKAYLGDKFTYTGEYNWWIEKRKVAKMHPYTANFVSVVFETLARLENNDIPILKDVTPDQYFCKRFLNVLYHNYSRKETYTEMFRKAQGLNN